jgi:hypothetical protein
MQVYVEGVGLAGPGLAGWRASRAMLAGRSPYQPGPTTLGASELLPAAERRRAGMPVRLALAAGGEAVAAAGRDASGIATVFASSSGDCDNVHVVLETLAAPTREVSPTRFHNSVHNAPAGYWSIATQCRAPSTSLACHDGSFAAGLLEAACQAASTGSPVALIAYDHPYPDPLHKVRPVGAPFGVALVLAPVAGPRSVASLDVRFVPESRPPTPASGPALEALRASVPAARSLPLLAGLAREERGSVALEYVAGSHLSVAIAPCA